MKTVTPFVAIIFTKSKIHSTCLFFYHIWKGFKKSFDKIGVIDDVLTTGSHFRAMSDFFKENGYEGQIIGIFLSRAVYTVCPDPHFN